MHTRAHTPFPRISSNSQELESLNLLRAVESALILPFTIKMALTKGYFSFLTFMLLDHYQGHLST